MTLIHDFHEKFDLPAPRTIPVAPNEDEVRFRLRLIREEYTEVREEMLKLLVPEGRGPDYFLDTFRALLKELADLRYVTEGAAVTFGLDIEAAYLEVHQSNMTKSPPPEPGGKVVKGPDYEPADLTHLVPPVIEGTCDEDVREV